MNASTVPKVVIDPKSSEGQYFSDLFAVVSATQESSKQNNLLGYHFPCADGVSSAALFYVSSLSKKDKTIKSKEEGLSSSTLLFSEKDINELLHDYPPIPLAYSALKDSEIRPWLCNQSWYGVLDLEPFPTNLFSLYVDHHVSTVHQAIHSHKIVFDSHAPSACSLISKLQFDDFTELHHSLSNLTEITDTASFKLEPPTQTSELTSISDLSFHELYPKHQEELAWALNDAAIGAASIGHNYTLLKLLIKQGLFGLLHSSTLTFIRDVREKRKKVINLSQKVDVSDITIVFTEKDLDLKSILHYLQKKGCKVAISAKIQSDITKLSFRVNKNVSSSELQLYRVDSLAKQFNGGGHPGAAGGATSSLSSLIKVVTKWKSKIDLEMQVVDLDKL